MSSAADIARKVFERMLALLGQTILDEAKQGIAAAGGHVPGYVQAVEKVVSEMTDNLRKHFERAIVELRYEFMAVTIAVLDEAEARAQSEAAAALERGRKIAEGMDIEVVPLCGRCGHGADEHQVEHELDGLRPCLHSEVLAGICQCRDYVAREGEVS